MAENLRALVRVLHCPKSQIDGRAKVFPKGFVFAASELGAEDIRHMLRQGTIEETDDPVGDGTVTAAGEAMPEAASKAVAPARAMPVVDKAGKPAAEAGTAAGASAGAGAG
jgi:hypothetical protein